MTTDRVQRLDNWKKKNLRIIMIMMWLRRIENN